MKVRKETFKKSTGTCLFARESESALRKVTAVFFFRCDVPQTAVGKCSALLARVHGQHFLKTFLCIMHETGALSYIHMVSVVLRCTDDEDLA